MTATATCQDRTGTVRAPGCRDDWNQAAALLHDYAEWIRVAARIDPLVEQPSFAVELAGLERTYDGRGGVLFVAFDGTLAVGTVAVRFHLDGTAEMKRMYVRAMARGRGIADVLVERAATESRRRGCRTLWLETLPGVMDAAIAIYRRHGFVPARSRTRTIDVDGLAIMERPLGLDAGVVS